MSTNKFEDFTEQVDPASLNCKTNFFRVLAFTIFSGRCLYLFKVVFELIANHSEYLTKLNEGSEFKSLVKSLILVFLLIFVSAGPATLIQLRSIVPQHWRSRQKIYEDFEITVGFWLIVSLATMATSAVIYSCDSTVIAPLIWNIFDGIITIIAVAIIYSPDVLKAYKNRNRDKND